MTDTETFSDAEKATVLLDRLSSAAQGAVKHGVDRDWVNARLNSVGAKLVTGRTEYRMNIPITGAYGWRCVANSRAEALARFKVQIDRVREAGKITADGSYDNVYDVTFDSAVPIDEAVTFYSGPEDPNPASGPVPGVDDTKAWIRSFLKAAVTETSWGYSYAQTLLNSMGIDGLPELRTRLVKVPVGGTVEINIRAFDDATDADIQAAATGVIRQSPHVYVQAAELVGEAKYTGRMLPEGDGSEAF